jgi:uncharacterized protein
VGIRISKDTARRFLLAYQGLRPPRVLKGKQGVLDYIRKVGCIQYDPLDIVGKNPELVLQSRVANFSREHLKELLYDERLLIDGWDKMMSIYSVEDWPCFSRSRDRYRASYSDSTRPANAIVPELRKELQKRGPLSSIELDFDQKTDWHWGPTSMARAALESMYFWGELIIHHKVHTRRVYDLATRHIPLELLEAPDPFDSEDEYLEWHVARRIGGIGMLWERSGGGWLGVHNLKAATRKRVLSNLVAKNRTVELVVDDIDRPFYILADQLPLLDHVSAASAAPTRAAVIAPLDNLLWDRKMISAIFGFDYVWEVYKPVQERVYGYYVLPVLYGDRFVGRFEPGKDKATGSIAIKDWWWEPDVRVTNRMRVAIRSCMMRLTKLLGAPELTVTSSAALRSGIDWLRCP